MLPWVEGGGSGVLGGKTRGKVGGYLVRIVVQVI